MNISVVPTPFMHPGKCIGCGGSTTRDGRTYLDTGVHVPIYGKIYICSLCMVHLAGLFGMVPEQAVLDAQQAKQDYEKTLNDVVEENGRLRRALSELDFIGTFDHRAVVVPPIEPEHNPASEKPARRGSKPVVKPVEGKLEDKSGSAESNDGSGSPKLHGDDAEQLRQELRGIRA